MDYEKISKLKLFGALVVFLGAILFVRFVVLLAIVVTGTGAIYNVLIGKWIFVIIDGALCALNIYSMKNWVL